MFEMSFTCSSEGREFCNDGPEFAKLDPPGFTLCFRNVYFVTIRKLM